MHWRQIAPQVAVRFAGSSSRQPFAERGDSWRDGLPKAERIRLWCESHRPNASLIAIAAEEADLRAAKQSRNA